MEFKSLKSLNINLNLSFNKLKDIIKDILSHEYFWQYFILSIILTVVFTVFTFPYEIILQNYIKNIEKVTRKRINIENLDINILSASTIDSVTIDIDPKSNIKLTKIDFDFPVNPFNLLFTKKFDGKLNIQNFNYSSNDFNFKCKVQTIYFFQLLNSNSTITGNTILSLNNISIHGISIQGFTIPDLIISTIKSEIDIEKNSLLKIKYIIFSGNDIKGSCNGIISLSKNFKNSTINLEISIDHNSNIVQEYKLLLEPIFKDLSKDLKFKLMGTIGNPKFIYH